MRPMDLSFKLNNFSRLASFFLPSYDSLAYKVTRRPGFVPIRLELSSGLLASDHQQANTRGLLLVPDLTLSSPILGFQDSLPFYSRLHHVLCQTNLYFLPHRGSELSSTLKLNNNIIVNIYVALVMELSLIDMWVSIYVYILLG